MRESSSHWHDAQPIASKTSSASHGKKFTKLPLLVRLLKPTIAEVPSLLNVADESAGVGGSSVDFSTVIVWFDGKNLTSAAYSAADRPEMRASNRNLPAEPATNAKLSAAPCLDVALEMVKVEMGSELG